LNVIASIFLLMSVFGDKDMSATADMVTMANEMGENEVHYVPRESYRRRLYVYFWDSGGEEQVQQWLRYGVTELLTQDLEQSPFLLVSSPWEGFYSELQEAGFDDGLDVPVSLKREIADEANRDYFVDGEISRADGQFEVTARVWSSSSLELIGESSATGWDLMKIVDELAVDIRNLLDTPPGGSDFPLGETFGESELALQRYIEARNAVLISNDREAANRLYDQALNEDPDFAKAWYMKSFALWEQGDGAATQAALEEAQKRSYRLSERDQVNVKLRSYSIAGENEKVETLLRMRTRIVGDASSYQTLGNFLMLSGRTEEAKEQFKRQMEIDSSAIGTLLTLANLERSADNVEGAIDYVLEYIEQRPEDLDSLQLLGDLYIEAGDLDAARGYYEQAQILEEPPLESTLELALLSIRQGEWKKVNRLVDEARSHASTPAHWIALLQVEIYLQSRLGRIENVLELIENVSNYSQQALTPVDQVFNYYLSLIQFNLLLGRVGPAEEALASAREALQAPIDGFLSFSEVYIAVSKNDLEAAERALEEAASFIERFNAEYFSFVIPMAAARIAEARGEYFEVGELYSDALARMRRSAFAGAFQDGQSEVYGMCAQAYVQAGELEWAQGVIEEGFSRDAAEPALWVARAMLQEAQGAPQMALASVNYALAIWSNADPDYHYYRDAKDLAQRLEQSLQ
jgi:tetratricopeptide (TPR) repeat protein